MGKGFDFSVRRLTDDQIARDLAALEQEFGMASAEFLLKYNRGELGETPAFIRWAGLLWLRSKVDGTKQVSA